MWHGLDLLELGMVVYLLAHTVHGIYRINNHLDRDPTISLMWVGYTFFSGLFLWGVLGEVLVDDILINRLTTFLSQ